MADLRMFNLVRQEIKESRRDERIERWSKRTMARGPGALAALFSMKAQRKQPKGRK